MKRQLLFSLATAIGLIFSWSFPSYQRERIRVDGDCFMPGFVMTGTIGFEESEEKFGIEIIEADEAEFSFKLIEWLKELF